MRKSDCPFFSLQRFAQIVGFLRVAGRAGHARRAAAAAQDHAAIAHVEIAHERLVMRLQRIERPVIAVPGNGKQRAFEMTARDAAVGGAEAIDDDLELGAHAVVVQRGCKHNHIGIKYRLS